MQSLLVVHFGQFNSYHRIYLKFKSYISLSISSKGLNLSILKAKDLFMIIDFSFFIAVRFCPCLILFLKQVHIFPKLPIWRHASALWMHFFFSQWGVCPVSSVFIISWATLCRLCFCCTKKKVWFPVESPVVLQLCVSSRVVEWKLREHCGPALWLVEC